MKMLCVAGDVPLPANNGGRVDVWRRLQALKSAGHELALLCWYDARRDAPMSSLDLEKLRTVCSELRIVPITRSPVELLARLVNLWRMPSHAASRWVTLPHTSIAAWASAFAPDAVLVDGLYGGAVGAWLARQSNKLMLFRSHNIEHEYMRDQAAHERRPLRQLGLFVNQIGLEAFERRMFRKSAQVFDISVEDCAFWRAQGYENLTWLPTSIDSEFIARLEKAPDTPPIDVLYFGNLNTPNNVDAVRWLIEAVLPKIPNRDLRVTLAGSRPSREVLELVQRDTRIELIENPEFMPDVVARAGTIVNPMRAGSGVNLKSVEMLFSDAALVSTTVGVKGLPDNAKACFLVADDAQGFADGILAGVARGKIVSPERNPVREQFSLEAVAKALAPLEQKVQGWTAT